MKATRQSALSRRAFLAGGATLAAGALCAGCASATGATSTASSSDDSSSASNQGESGSSSSSSETASSNKLITGASAYASTNYNPIGFNGGASLTMAATRHVLEGLYDLDVHTFQPYPALAEGDPRWHSSVACDVALRADARFSDGAAVTAADVANAFEKNKDNPTTGYLLDAIDTVVAQDERTVSITLNYPMEGLLESRLSLVKIYPANREDELDTLPIGSGPWMYAPGGLDGKSGITFKPNPHYNGPFPAEADNMSWTVISKDEGMRVSALRDRVVQVAESIPADSADLLARSGVSTSFVQGFSQPFLMFNTLKGPFANKLVRQAILFAIDTDKLIKNQMGGHAAPLTGFLPENHPNYHRAATVYTHDPLRAKAQLLAAGAKDLSFTLIVNDNWVASLAPSIAEDLQSCGITCTVKQGAIRWNEYADTDRVLPYEVMLASGDPSRFGNDPDLLLSWWYGDNIWTRGRSCWARDPNSSFGQMQALLQAARETNGDQRQELWNQCFDIVADEVPLYGLFHRELATGWQSDRISGFEPLSFSGLDFLGCTVA